LLKVFVLHVIDTDALHCKCRQGFDTITGKNFEWNCV